MPQFARVTDDLTPLGGHRIGSSYCGLPGDACLLKMVNPSLEEESVEGVGWRRKTQGGWPLLWNNFGR